MTFRDIKEFDQKIGLWFHGSLALPLLIFIFLYLEITHDSLPPLLGHNDLITWGILAASTVIAWLAYSAYRHGLADIRREMNLWDKLQLLCQIYIRLYKGFLISSLIMVGGYYITGSVILLVGYIFILFILSLYRPAKHRYLRDLPLTTEEKKIVTEGGEILQ